MCSSKILPSGARLVRVVWMALFLVGQAFVGLAYAQQLASQFILKLKNSVELSATPTVRRLEQDGAALSAVLLRNNVDAQWIRAGTLGTQVMRWGSGVQSADYQSVLNRLSSDPEVEFAIEDRPVRLMATPNDSSFSSQWALRSTTNQAGAKFDQAWDWIKGSASVVIAVLDTGVLFETPELKGRLLSGYDFISSTSIANDGDGRDSNPADPGNWITSAESQSGSFQGCSVKDSNWHGTFVSGLIAANTHNSTGISGADWNARILPVRVLGKCGGYLSDVLDGMLWAAGLDVPGIARNTTPAAVINLSLGGSSSTCSTVEQTTVDRVTAAGALVVASAGNGGGAVESPANCNNVLGVGALDRDGSRAAYSAIGTGIDLMAPGGYSYGLLGLGNSGTTVPSTPSVVTKTGTSFSAPMVAAAAGLMKAVNSALTPAELMAQLTSTASAFLSPVSNTCLANSGAATCNCTTTVCGAGMLNAAAAVQAVRSTKPLANASMMANAVSGSEVNNGVQASALNPVQLRGSASTVTSGRTVASYLWEQVSGTALMTGTASTADVDLAAASATSDLVFKLTVTDSVGETHSSYSALRVIASGDAATTPTTMATEVTSGTASTGSTSSTTDSTSSVSSGDSGGGGGGGGGAINSLALAMMCVLLAFARPRQ